jgi:hypothetical protein
LKRGDPVDDATTPRLLEQASREREPVGVERELPDRDELLGRKLARGEELLVLLEGLLASPRVAQ